MLPGSLAFPDSGICRGDDMAEGILCNSMMSFYEELVEFDSEASVIVGIVKKNVEPFAGSDSTQIRPPWRSTIFLQFASPIPVPGLSRLVSIR